MKTSRVAVALAALVATAAVVAPRTAQTQGTTPIKIAPVAPIATVTPARLAAAAIIAKPTTPIALKTRLQTFTDLSGQMFGAGAFFVSALGEDGAPTRTFKTPFARAAISPHGAAALLVGDLGAKALHTMDPKTGALTPLLKLSEVTDPAAAQMPAGRMLADGALAGVASDGKNVFVAIEAGFSSSVFKIDPTTKRIVERAWATAGDPQAMVVHAGSLFVLVDDGSRVRRFTDTLQRSKDSIELGATGVRGLGIRAGELRLLGPTQILRSTVDPLELTRAGITKNLDQITVLPPRLRPGRILPLLQARRFAVLITGDLAENFSGECFWNDTVWMYKSLLANGYDPADVFVLYGDGADFMSQNPAYRHTSTVTDFAATAANVNAVLDGLANGDAARGIPKMDSNDTLFVWTFDHGGRTNSGEATLGLRGGSLTASAIAAKLNAISYARRAVFMQQCYSGGFIEPLKNAKTFISTASSATEVARPADTENEVVNNRTYSHGEFNYWVISALNRLTPANAAVDGDSNNDAFVSSAEMHTWNVTHESRAETPQSNDMGGVGALFKFKK